MQQEIPVLARPAAGGCLTISLPRAGGRVAEKRAVLAGRGVHICHTYTKHIRRNSGHLGGCRCRQGNRLPEVSSCDGSGMLRLAVRCLPGGVVSRQRE